MAETSRPDPANGYVVTTDEFERMGALNTEDGVFGQPTDTPVVYADSTGRQVKVHAGKIATVRGYLWYADPTTDQIVSSLPANVSGFPRIDRLVLQLSRSTRQVRVFYKQGTAAAFPSAPALQQDAGYSTGLWEYPLARWNVANGYTTVAAGDVTPEAWYPLPSGLILCTSTSRPFGNQLRTGQRIYETDTKFTYSYNGSIWLRDEQAIELTTDTSWTSNITPAALTSANTTPAGGFQFAMEANRAYLFEVHILAQSGGGNIGFDVTFPFGGRVDVSWQGMSTGGVYLDGGIANWASGAGAALFGAPASPGVGVTTVRGRVLCGTTAGNLVCQFAQATSNASPTTLIRGSFFKHRQTA